MTFRELADLIEGMDDKHKDDDVMLLLLNRGEAYPICALEGLHEKESLDDSFSGQYVFMPWCPDEMDVIDIDEDHGDKYKAVFGDDDSPTAEE